jgi:choline dehydrogenase
MSQQIDYIVVGAGSAGCAVAARLSKNRSAQVLLIEAGGGNRKLAVKAVHRVPTHGRLTPCEN